jgi:hypothetical protein
MQPRNHLIALKRHLRCVESAHKFSWAASAVLPAAFAGGGLSCFGIRFVHGETDGPFFVRSSHP